MAGMAPGPAHPGTGAPSDSAGGECVRFSHGPRTFPPLTCSRRLHGSYEVMRGGHMNEAFVDFTGGVGEVLYLREDIPGLFSALRHALAKESLVGATALVREPDSHGDPHRDQSTVRAGGGGRGSPVPSSLCSRLAGLSLQSSSSRSKGNVCVLITRQASGTA